MLIMSWDDFIINWIFLTSRYDGNQLFWMFIAFCFSRFQNCRQSNFILFIYNHIIPI